ACRRLGQAHRMAGLGCLERLSAEEWLADDNAKEMLGLPVGEERLCFGEVFQHLHPDDHPQLEAALAGKNLAETDVEFRVLGDTERLVHVIGVSSSTPEMTVLLQDISARSTVERRRAATIERIAETNRLETLGTLASGIAHEINNPAQYIADNLVFINGALSKLLDLATEVEKAARDGGTWEAVVTRLASLKLDFLRKELPVATRQSIEGIERIGSIVQGIRDFCYPSTTASTLFDLNQLIQITVAMTRNKWKHVATLDLDLEEMLPMISGVEGEIMQVLINLIVNATQAIAELKAPQRGRITVRTRKDDDSVEIVVTDTGIGIPGENVARIFDLFYTTKGPSQGTGQGLTISQAIIARHNGQIRVESSPGAGARFHIHLPIDCSNAAH
ncbi:MAG: hypothetical protein EPN26_13575, partial [Rhodospirillales bacterium]